MRVQQGLRFRTPLVQVLVCSLLETFHYLRHCVEVFPRTSGLWILRLRPFLGSTVDTRSRVSLRAISEFHACST